LNFQTIEIVTVMGKYFNRFYSESVNSYLSKTVNYSLSVTRVRRDYTLPIFFWSNNIYDWCCTRNVLVTSKNLDKRLL